MEKTSLSEKDEYIAKLEAQIQTLDRILKMDSGTVIGAELKKKLRELKDEAETAFRKLKNNEFEIAIVGLEKAGKSTFANALMENNLLPTKDLRCTFTSTQIEYSGDNIDDNAVVFFYTADEFDKDFKDKINKLGVPNPERYSFDTFAEADYLRVYEEKVSDEKKRLYGDSIHEDILAVIRNCGSLSRLLGTPPISFSADRMEVELEAYITDEKKARAVKQVVIRSKKLNQMKNAVIFDVPGFNSPTELHKIQTLERMKSADAIIVVANGVSPSLTGESLKILRESDDDGNPLSEKLFVFANKTEGARDIRKNIDDTIREWTGRGFVSEQHKDRILFGSALAHLQANGIDPDNRVLRSFREREADMPNGDGIEAARAALARYNENERFDVLKRRINRIHADIRKVYETICEENEDVATDRSYSAALTMAVELVDNIRPIAKAALETLKQDIRDNIPRDLPLSLKISDYIIKNVTTDKYGLTEELFEEHRKRSHFVGDQDDVGRIEDRIREEKFTEMYEDFSQNVIRIADDYHLMYAGEVVEKILCAMDVRDDSPYYEDLKGLLKNEIAPYTRELDYQSLIERFSRYIYEILIMSQYNPERLRQFYKHFDIYYSLSVFYRKTGSENDLSYINVALKDQPLCGMLLFHHYLGASDSCLELVDNICKIAGMRILPGDVVELVSKAFLAVGGNKDRILNKVRSAVEKAVKMDENRTTSSLSSFQNRLGADTAGRFDNLSDDFLRNLLKNTLFEVIRQGQSCSMADKDEFTRYYQQYHDSLRNGKLYSLDDFRSDFDDDIRILQDVLLNGFVRAVSMEKPFVAKEVKSIDDIIQYIESKRFGHFLSENFTKIKYRETQVLDKQNREREQKAAILREIRAIFDTLSHEQERDAI